MGGGTSKQGVDARVAAAAEKKKAEEDEPDDWDKRISSTGCADENMKMTDCYYETKDWRKCKDEMEMFRKCWKAHGNDQRTSTKDADQPRKPWGDVESRRTPR